MGRFNMWMANLMRGRYGSDESYIVDRCIDFDRGKFIFAYADHQLACGCFADIYLLSCIFKEHKQESG